MSNFLLDCIRNSQDDNFDHFCLSTLKSYAYDEQAIQLIKNAMLDEQSIFTMPGKDSLVILTFKEKIAFIKLLCASPFVKEIEREIIKQRVFPLVQKGSIFNDLVDRCHIGVPDP